MVSEEIRRVARIRLIDRALGAGGVAGFLMREGPDGLETIVSGKIGRPGGREAVRLFQHRLRVAKAEMRGVANSNRQQIDRTGIEDFAPDRERLPEGAALPGGKCRDVELFAPCSHGGSSLGGGETGGDRAAVRGIGAREHQVALEAVPHDEIRIGRERVVHQLMVSTWYFR